MIPGLLVCIWFERAPICSINVCISFSELIYKMIQKSMKYIVLEKGVGLLGKLLKRHGHYTGSSYVVFHLDGCLL